MSSFSIFNNSSSLARGQISKNSMVYIKRLYIDSILSDNEVGANTEYLTSDGYFPYAVGINPFDENLAFYTLQTFPDESGISNDISINYLTTNNDFTMAFKYSIHQDDTQTPLINIDLENQPTADISFQVLFSKDFINASNDSFTITILKRSLDDISFNLQGNFAGMNISSADFNNEDISGNIKNYISQITYNTTSTIGGQMEVFLSNSTHNFTSKSIYIIKTFYVKIVQNVLGEYVYAFSDSNNGTYINQKIISLNPGALIRFDTSDSSLLNKNIVFGTQEDNVSTIDTSITNYVGTQGNNGSYIIIDLSNATTRIEYFDNNISNMGYIPGLDFKKYDFSMNIAFESNISSNTVIGSDNKEVNFTVSGYSDSFANGDYKLRVSANDNNSGFPLLNVINSSGIDFDWQIDFGSTTATDSITVVNSLGETITYNDNSWIEITLPYSLDLKTVTIIGRQSSTGSYPNNVEFYGSYNYVNYEFISSNTITYTNTIGVTTIQNNIKCFPIIVMIDIDKKNVSINYFSLSGDVYDRTHTNVYDVYKDSKFLINGNISPYLTLLPNNTYAFYQRESSNSGDTIIFGTDHDNTSSIVSYQKVVGSSGNKGAYTEVTVSNEYIYYFSYENTNITNKPPTIGVKKTTNIFGENVFAFTEVNGNTFYNQEYTPIVSNSYFVFKTNDPTLLGTSFNIVDITTNNPLTFNDVSTYNTDFSTIGTSPSSKVFDTLDNTISELFITDINSSDFLGYRPYTKIDSSLTNYVVKTVTISNNLFYIDDVSLARLTFEDSNIFVFDQSDPSNIGNTLVVGIKPGDDQYRLSNITIMGEPGRTGAYTLFEGGTNVFYYSFQNENISQYVPVVKVKIQQNILGENVFALTHDNGDIFYNQRLLPLESGATYVIDTSDSTMNNIDFNIFTASSTTPIQDYITKTGTFGQQNSFASIFVSESYSGTPLYYFNSYANKLGYIPYTNVPNVSYSGGTQIYAVTVLGEKFYIDGQQIPEINFINNKVYVFDQSDSSNEGNTLVISANPNDSQNLFTNITVMGEPGQQGAYSLFTANTDELYYFSYENINYGYIPPINIILKISTNSIGQNVFYGQYVNNKQIYDTDSDFIIQRDISFNSNNKYIIDTSDPSLLNSDLIYSFDRINSSSLYDESSINVSSSIGTSGSITTIDLFDQTVLPFYLQLNGSSYNYNFVPLQYIRQTGNVVEHTITVVNNKFYIDGVFNKFFHIEENTNYIFTQENNSNSGNTFILTTDIDNSNNMVNNSVHKFAGITDSYTLYKTGATLTNSYLYYMSFENSNIGYEINYYILKTETNIAGDDVILSKKSLNETSFVKQRSLSVNKNNSEIIYLDVSDPSVSNMEFIFATSDIGVNGKYGTYMNNDTISSISNELFLIEGTKNGSIITLDLANYNSTELLYLYEKNNLVTSFENINNAVNNNSLFQTWINYYSFNKTNSSIGKEDTQIAMSHDGSTIVCGDPDTGNGKVYIKKLVNGTYYETVISGSNGNKIGSSVDLSDDGNVVVIGVPYYTIESIYSFYEIGKILIYNFNNTTLSYTKSFELSSPTTSNYDHFGKSVSISSDGNTIAVSSDINGIVCFTFNSSNNTYEEGSFINSNKNIKISKDGNTIFTNSGDIYTFANNNWSLNTVTLNKNNTWTNTNIDFNSLALSYNANIVAISKQSSGTKPGYVETYTYNNSTDTWDKLGQTLWPEFNDDNFGKSISLSSDGLKLLVGSPNNQDTNQNTDAGGMRVYHYMTDKWVQYGLDINNPLNTNGQLGRAVSCNSDMSLIVSSTPYDTNSTIYYFKIPDIVKYDVTIANNKFYLDGIETPTISFEPYTKYVFDQTDSSNTNNQIILTTVQDNSSNIVSDIKIHQDPGSDNSYMYFITGTTPGTLYYMSYQTSNMGN